MRPTEGDGASYVRTMHAAEEAERRWLSHLFDGISADPTGVEAVVSRKVERSWIVRSSRTGERRRFLRR